MTKYRQKLRFYPRYAFASFALLCSFPYTILSQCPGSSCTYTISGTDSGTYTVNTGEKICIESNAVFTGTIQLFGGEINNCGTNPQIFSMNLTASGVLNNYGTIQYTTNKKFPNGFTVNNYQTLIADANLTIEPSASFNNFGTATVTGTLLNKNQIDNSGTLNITGPFSENTNAVLINSGAITAASWTINGTWENSGTIDLVGTFNQGSNGVGTINGGCISSDDWTHQGTITGNTCGDINIAGSSLLTSSGSLSGDIAIIDATPPGSAPFIDNSFGTIGSGIVWTSCSSCETASTCGAQAPVLSK